MAATLDADRATSIAAAEKLHQSANGKARGFATIAYVFSLLQGEQGSIALKVCQRTALSTQNHSFAATLALSEAEAGLVTETCNNIAGERVSYCSGASSVTSLTETAMGHYRILSKNLASDSAELGTIIHNNKGVSLLLQGKIEEALACFQEATNLTSMIQTPNVNDCFLQPHFNLTLLHWRNGQIAHAVGSWLPVRQFLKVDKGNEDAMDLSHLRTSLAHALDVFRDISRNKALDTQFHVAAWQPGSKKMTLGGMDTFQVRLLDIVMLQCAAELATCDMVQACLDRNEGLLSQVCDSER